MKKNIALIAGGDSGEFEVSVGSAGLIEKNLDEALYNCYKILIRGREWYYQDAGGRRYDVDKNDFSLLIDGRKVGFDCAFIAIHGTPGEDGKLQGYFDMMGIPYTTCDHASSAVTFSKYFSNDLAPVYGVKTGKSIVLRSGDNIDTGAIAEQLGLPCFVKPNEGGSSIGTSRADSLEDLLPAIKKAFAEDAAVMIQALMPGKEITCGILKHKGTKHIFPLTEIVSKKDFFDYEAKYTPGMADEITPARISAEMAARISELSAVLYDKFLCAGVVRFDYIIDGDEIWFLEANTVPGLSENSIVPRMAREQGITMQSLFTMMIEDALCRAGKS